MFNFSQLSFFLSTSLWDFLNAVSRTEFCGMWPESLETLFSNYHWVLPWVICLFWFLDWYLLSCNWTCLAFWIVFQGLTIGPCQRANSGFLILCSSYCHTSLKHRGILAFSRKQKISGLPCADAIFPVHIWKTPWMHEAFREMPSPYCCTCKVDPFVLVLLLSDSPITLCGLSLLFMSDSLQPHGL